jgi:PAS domain S-box-containing protein
LDFGSDTFRFLLDSLEIGVAIAERSGTILYANARFAELLAGSSLEEVSGSELKTYVLATSWDQLADALAQSEYRQTEGQMTVLSVDAGDRRMIHLSFSPHNSVNGKPTIRIVATEVTELVAANRALKQSEASLHTMSARLLQVQDEERRRIARDLHDVTGQELAVAVMSLDNLKNLADAPGADLKAAIGQSAELLRKVDNEIRTLSYLLHPPLLEEMGLGSALPWFIDGFSKRTGIEVNAEIAEKLPRFSIEFETAVFRVVQEALTNVFRHSGSHRAWVRVWAAGSYLQASVEDEGKGIERGKAESKKPGVGIQSMKDRLRVFGGALEFRSGRRGTRVIATIPLTEAVSGVPNQELNFEAGGIDAPAAVGEAKRILIADDHEVAREGIRALLKDQPDLEVCGEAMDGLDAIEKARQLKPDLVIMDLSMPHMSGLAALRHIRASGLQARVLIYTTHSYPELKRVAQAADCDGFVLKSNASHDLIRGVRTVLDGKKFFADDAVETPPQMREGPSINP